jgi:hypothetical protein
VTPIPYGFPKSEAFIQKQRQSAVRLSGIGVYRCGIIF